MTLKMHHTAPKCIHFSKKFRGYTSDPQFKRGGRKRDGERKERERGREWLGGEGNGEKRRGEGEVGKDNQSPPLGFDGSAFLLRSYWHAAREG
jgi:hypothetical protein